MKKLILALAVFAFVFNVNASNNDTEKGIGIKTENFSIQTKNSKRKKITGKTVTRLDYVKTSNPKRLHWNRIHKRNNPVKSNVMNHSPKRQNLMRLLSKKRTGVSSPKSPFVQRKRNHS